MSPTLLLQVQKLGPSLKSVHGYAEVEVTPEAAEYIALRGVLHSAMSPVRGVQHIVRCQVESALARVVVMDGMKGENGGGGGKVVVDASVVAGAWELTCEAKPAPAKRARGPRAKGGAAAVVPVANAAAAVAAACPESVDPE